MTDTMTDRPELGPALSAYRLYATVLHAGESPFLALECPAKHDARPADTCNTNLLDHEQRKGGIQLVDLVRLVVMHDDPVPSIERSRRISDLYRQLGQLGIYEVSAEEDVHPFLGLACPYLGGRCPGSEDGECAANLIPEVQQHIDLGTLLLLAASHDDARYGVPVERIIELRQALVQRRRHELYTRETADGSSAGLASSRADLYGQLIADLDKAMV